MAMAMAMRMKQRAWILAIAMGLTAVFSAVFMPRPPAVAQARAQTPLEQLFPERFGGWRLDPAASALVRPAFEQARQFQVYDQVLERTYMDEAGHRIMLSVAYGRQQSVGLQMHRPEVCYKAGGFQVEGVTPDELALTSGQRLPITRVFASMAGRPEPITYWRLLGDEVVGSESQFKLRQLSLGATGVIPDGMLVRVSSIDEDRPAAYALHDAFIREMATSMDAAQRSRVLGQR